MKIIVSSYLIESGPSNDLSRASRLRSRAATMRRTSGSIVPQHPHLPVVIVRCNPFRDVSRLDARRQLASTVGHELYAERILSTRREQLWEARLAKLQHRRRVQWHSLAHWLLRALVWTLSGLCACFRVSRCGITSLFSLFTSSKSKYHHQICDFSYT